MEEKTQPKRIIIHSPISGHSGGGGEVGMVIIICAVTLLITFFLTIC